MSTRCQRTPPAHSSSKRACCTSVLFKIIAVPKNEKYMISMRTVMTMMMPIMMILMLISITMMVNMIMMMIMLT